MLLKRLIAALGFVGLFMAGTAGGAAPASAQACGPWNNGCQPRCGPWNNWCQPVCGPWNGWCAVGIYINPGYGYWGGGYWRGGGGHHHHHGHKGKWKGNNYAWRGNHWK